MPFMTQSQSTHEVLLNALGLMCFWQRLNYLPSIIQQRQSKKIPMRPQMCIQVINLEKEEKGNLKREVAAI